MTTMDESDSTSTRFNGDATSTRDRCTLLGIDWIDEAPPVDDEVTTLISPDVAVRRAVVPLRIEDGRLVVAMVDPLDILAVDEISTLSGHAVTRVGLEKNILSDLLRAHYGTTAARMAESLGSQAGESDGLDEHNLDAIEADDIHRMAEQPTLINLVNLLLLEAIQLRASDVHIEPFESELKIKFRIDGVLLEQQPPPKHLQPALIGRVKIMAGMNIAERYVPQDGHINLRFEGRKVDLRVSTVPTLYGESVVMRILDKSALRLDFDSLGMSAAVQEQLGRLLDKPHGLVLVTGPTGSGKTTTLYAALSKLYDPRKKIITIEDPVEYELAGINQIPVNPKRGLTFATGLRSILRQDPDIIFVGEIRDAETAEISIRSALTGHLIFSTLHTNDAASSITRLVDMGVEPFLVGSSLVAVLAQRLVRVLCLECREAYVPSSVELQEIGVTQEGPIEIYRSVGCERCNHTGYRGRLGIFEMMMVDDDIRALVAKNIDSKTIKKLAVSKGMGTLRQDGARKVLMGITSVAEVLRATEEEGTVAQI